MYDLGLSDQVASARIGTEKLLAQHVFSHNSISSETTKLEGRESRKVNETLNEILLHITGFY